MFVAECFRTRRNDEFEVVGNGGAGECSVRQRQAVQVQQISFEQDVAVDGQVADLSSRRGEIGNRAGQHVNHKVFFVDQQTPIQRSDKPLVANSESQIADVAEVPDDAQVFEVAGHHVASVVFARHVARPRGFESHTRFVGIGESAGQPHAVAVECADAFGPYGVEVVKELKVLSRGRVGKVRDFVKDQIEIRLRSRVAHEALGPLGVRFEIVDAKVVLALAIVVVVIPQAVPNVVLAVSLFVRRNRRPGLHGFRITAWSDGTAPRRRSGRGGGRHRPRKSVRHKSAHRRRTVRLKGRHRHHASRHVRPSPDGIAKIPRRSLRANGRRCGKHPHQCQFCCRMDA